MTSSYQGYLLVPEAGKVAIHDRRLYYAAWGRDSFLAEAETVEGAKQVIDCWEEDRERNMTDG